MRIFCIILLAKLFLLSACTSTNVEKEEEQNKDESYQMLKDYYYPVDDLAEGMVYIYENKKMNNQPDYWLYKTVYDEAGNQFLVATQYNLFFDQRQMLREWVVADGTILKDYRFFQKDTASGKVLGSQATIQENVIFPFKAVDDQDLAYRFQLKFSILPDTAVEYKITRDRKFDKYLKYEYNGEELDAVQFKSIEYTSVENDVEGGSWDMQANLVEIYAKGLGLVYKSSDSKALPYEIQLKERISVQDFEAMQKKD